jgi:hypothetical protein
VIEQNPSGVPPRGPNCWECRYLAITWDSRMPYGCKYMGFRSKVIPSLEVLRTDGRFCGGFAVKLPQSQPRTEVKPTTKAVKESSVRQKNDPKKRIFLVNLKA